ncbi:hypothetical protein KGY14_08705 [Ameyamaea chiangmaiensis]|uniref:Uncharacterized protein n=2 Tax=Ameyamaea chiangmaiensis TaxID=442969 RepID=A0A850PCP7_9PROT|nr:hypothetical protein [Ameyamaea chiangmaiensis]NVN40419.1 hypothetical protein [Ameyamaea chiangmaiensis]
MPDDLRYRTRPSTGAAFIEKDMVFVLPARLKDFRRHLHYVAEVPGSDSALYKPLFRATCIVDTYPAPPGFDGPRTIYPFYARVARNKRHYRDYYMLFLFRHQPEMAKFQMLNSAAGVV